MINTFKLRFYIELCLFFSIINISLSIPEYKTFDLKILLNKKELDPFYIVGYENDTICKKWFPSLINPILLVDTSVKREDLHSLDKNFVISSPFSGLDDKIQVQLFSYSLFNEYVLFLARTRTNPLENHCYFGLSSGLSQYEYIDETHINLNRLGNETFFPKKVFSFSNWTLNTNKDEINSFFYFGDTHEFFDSKKGIIGSCDANKTDPFWGCIFTNISFNGKTESLMKDQENYYKIYFSTENHRIVIPSSFKDKFNNITGCTYNESNELSCEFFDDDEEYAEIKLINSNKMNITIEIDRMNRYIIQKENIEPDQTRIIIGEYDYFILPLIMFKKFYVQFDAENYKISFYTTDKTILQVEEDKKKVEKGSSKAGTVFLVIFIIILVLALVYGIFWIIKKRRSSVQQNINKYNKFEDEEDFKDMNEKRVF